MKINYIHKYIGILLIAFLFLGNNCFAQKKKKPKKKSEVNILARAYNDVTTRNNFYFNANLLYKDILKQNEEARQLDYTQLIPFYYHDWDVDFSVYSGDLETIVKKTSVVVQLHDHMRWKDDVYLLLAKARYLQGDYHEAYRGFRYIVTTMKGNVARDKSNYDQKARLKYLRDKQKELDQKAKDKKKEIEEKQQIRDAEMKEKIDAKEKEMADKLKQREKELKQKIKLKKKAIQRKKKGKKVKKDYNDIKVSDGLPSNKKEEKKKEKEEIEEFNEDDYSIDDHKNIHFRKVENPNDTSSLESDTLSEKEKENLDDLNLWEKIKHKPARAEAIVWLAKTYIAQENYADARSLITYGNALRKLTKKQRREIHLIDAYYYIKQESYELALEPLEKAIGISKKQEKAWYTFIMAQLYDELNQPEKSLEQYDAVLETKADFETRFFAKLNKADLYSNYNLTSNEEVYKMLNKLLKNGQNKLYKHKVHYALANLHLNAEETEKAKEHLFKAVEKSSDDNQLKALAFLKLGEIHYDEEKFILAAAFYDSTVAIANEETLENFDVISSKQVALASLAEHLTTIYETDSLLRLSKMSPEELNALIKEQKKEAPKTRKFRDLIEEGDFDNNFPYSNNSASTFVTNSSGVWYFYNADIKARGFNEFKRNWGNIKNTDNWRRKAASEDILVAETNIDPIEIGIIDSVAKTVDLVIPKSEEEIKAANASIAAAYYNSGTLFMHNLENTPKAIEYFEKYLQRYPGQSEEEKAHYALYLLYKNRGNMIAANKHKNAILENDQYSMIANAMTTDFEAVAKEVRESKDEVEILYASTYKYYSLGNYDKVILNNDKAITKYGENYYTPKFRFLEALSYGHLDSLVELKSILSEIIQKYPNHEVKPKAVEYLAIINKQEVQEQQQNKKTGKTDVKDEKVNESIYKVDNRSGLFGVVYIKDNTLPIQDFVKNVKEFNNENYNERNFKVSNAFISVKEPIMIIKRFKSKAEAVDYYNNIQDNKADLFGRINKDDIEIYIISQNNFRTLFQSKDIDAYRSFFIENYLNE